MKRYTSLPTILAALLGFSQLATAASPRFIFDPIEDQAQQCAALGPLWRERIQGALRLAKARTRNFLPSQSWDQLLTFVPKSAPVTPVPAQEVACKKFVADYSDPKLSEQIRGSIVAGFIFMEFTGCAAEFPELAASIRSAWIGAFQRNGLDPIEQTFDEGIRSNWRKPTADQRQRQECEKSIRFLGSGDFDEAASEQHIKRFLSDSDS